MKISKLEHVNLRTSQLDTMIAWYTDVLGMTRGARPNFTSSGAWMYAGETACVHLVEVVGDAGAGAEVALKLEHFAFSATGRAAFEARLNGMGVRFSSTLIDDIGVVQMNVWDPDGNHIHIDFAADEG